MRGIPQCAQQQCEKWLKGNEDVKLAQNSLPTISRMEEHVQTLDSSSCVHLLISYHGTKRMLWQKMQSYILKKRAWNSFSKWFEMMVTAYGGNPFSCVVTIGDCGFSPSCFKGHATSFTKSFIKEIRSSNFTTMEINEVRTSKTCSWCLEEVEALKVWCQEKQPKN